MALAPPWIWKITSVKRFFIKNIILAFSIVPRNEALHFPYMLYGSEEVLGQLMNRLRVKCVKCGKEWEKASLISWGPDDISSSLCDPCFREVISPIIRKRQIKEGNFACFGEAGTDCEEPECKYRQWCLRMEETEGPQKEMLSTAGSSR